MVLIEIEWLGGVEGAFYTQPAQAKARQQPQAQAEALPPADFVERMRKAYGG